jgi:WD40 repeat protein/serine/threonine protein kinase
MGHDLHGAPATFPLGMPVVVGIPRSLANAGTHARWQGSGNQNCRLLSSPRARYCRRHSVESGPGDPNAPTRTVLPGGSDAATDEGGDPDRTRSSADQTQASVAATPASSGEKARRPAPLQYRDPERYEVIAEHGRGGLGRVMRARDKELGRQVAIKEMLHPGMTSELRFFREALITARLEHPGIVPVHEAGRWPDGTPFYAMKLVAGRPLKAVIEDASSLDARLALLPHVIAVADAVAYAHSRGIIHRDLKPSNVIVGDFGETVVIDWGLAKDVAEPDDAPPSTDAPAVPGLTIAGTVLGTPGYMSPEQAAGTADTRSDIFAIGALLSHVLHGQPPAGASGAPADPAPARSSTKVPAALQAVVAKATAADPGARYATARALGDDLRQYQSGELVAAHRYSLAQLIQHWASRNTKLVAVAVAAFCVLGVTLVVSANRIIRERDGAQRARVVAESAQNSLVLSQARNALRHDPTLAVLWSQKYQGDDSVAAQDVVAEAVGRGVARFGASTHIRAIVNVREAAHDSFYSVSVDNTLRLWTVRDDVLNSRLVSDQVDDGSAVAAHVPRGRFAYLTLGGELHVVDAGRLVRNIRFSGRGANSLEFSPDGSRVLIGSTSGAFILDVDDDGHSLRLQEPLPDLGIGWSQDGGAVLGASQSGTVTRWDARTGRIDRAEPIADLHSAAFHAGLGVVAHQDGAVSFLDDSLRLHRRVPLPVRCGGPLVSPSGTSVMLNCLDRILVLDTSTGAVLYSEAFAAHRSPARYSANGEWLAFGTGDGRVHLISTFTWERRSYIGHAAPVQARVGFLPELVVSGDESGDIRLWSMPKPVRTVPLVEGDLRRVAASPDGRWFATDSSRGVVRLWSRDGQLVKEFRGHEGVIPSISFTYDSRFIVTPGWDHTIRLWPIEGDASPTILRGHDAKVMAARSFGGGLASIGHDGRLLIWDLATGTHRVAYTDGQILMRMDVLSTSLAVGGESGTVYEWSADTGTGKVVVRHERRVDAIGYSADGRWLVTSDIGGNVKVTERRTGRLAKALSLESTYVVAAFSADSRFLAVGAEDAQLHVFALSADSVNLVMQREANVKRVAFSQGGATLATICHDGLVRVWDLAAGTATVYPMRNEQPIGVAFAGNSTVAATTAYSLVIFDRADLGSVPLDSSRLRATAAAAVRQFEAPRRFAADDKAFLFGASVLNTK